MDKKSKTSPAIEILLLSDAHLGHPDRGLEEDVVIETLLEDVERLISEHEFDFDLIIFGGDLAYGELKNSTLKSQYENNATKFFSQLRERVGSKLPPIFLVAGNHDVNQGVISHLFQDGLRNIKSDEQATKTMYKDAVERGIIQQRLEDWKRFVKHHLKNQGTSDWVLDEEILMITGTHKVGDYVIGLVGYNTSSCSGEGNDRGFLWLTEHQRLSGLKAVKDSHIKIAVSHHDVDWLHDNEKTAARDHFRHKFQIHYSGHFHSNHVMAETEHLAIGADACYDRKSKSNGYAALRIFPEKNEFELYLRKYEQKGGGGWIANHIPDRTDHFGIKRGALTISNKKPYAATQPKNNHRIKSTASSPTVSGPIPTTINEFIKELQSKHGFRWEPRNFQTSKNPTEIYWPVTLRQPTPIHTVQSFAAAGLQKFGCRINICIDDLGSSDASCDQLYDSVSASFSKVGGNASEIVRRRFSEVLKCQSPNDPSRIWRTIDKWFGSDYHKLGEVLTVSKLLNKVGSLDELMTRKPKRLLTPVNVWSVLSEIASTCINDSFITLSGYDERLLWKAWRSCAADMADYKVGHLYIPELTNWNNQDSNKPIYMRSFEFVWNSREDIHQAIRSAIENDPDWWHSGKLPFWVFQGCFVLPNTITGKQSQNDLVGKTVERPEDLLAIDKLLIPEAIAAACDNWLF